MRATGFFNLFFIGDEATSIELLMSLFPLHVYSIKKILTYLFIWHYTFNRFFKISLPTRLFGLHVYLAHQSNKFMENEPFFSISCQGTKTVMLLPHTDVIIEQYPIEFCLVHWKKNIILFPLRGEKWNIS